MVKKWLPRLRDMFSVTIDRKNDGEVCLRWEFGVVFLLAVVEIIKALFKALAFVHGEWSPRDKKRWKRGLELVHGDGEGDGDVVDPPKMGNCDGWTPLGHQYWLGADEANVRLASFHSWCWSFAGASSWRLQFPSCFVWTVHQQLDQPGLPANTHACILLSSKWKPGICHTSKLDCI